MGALQGLIEPEAWQIALDKFGAATGLTIGVYESPSRLILGPVHATPLFEAITQGGRDPALFRACTDECLATPDSPVILDDLGVAVVGSPLRRGDEVVGAVVAGYRLTAFPEESAILRFARRHDLPMHGVWPTIRREAPLLRMRLRVYADLLAAFTETLLRETVRAQEAAQAAARLAEANEAKDQFLAMLAHELRNPLGPIQIATRLIGHSQASPADLEKAREVVGRQVGHLARLLDDLLDVSRITRGKIELRKESVDLATVVATALEASRPLIEERGHALAVSLPEQQVRLEADPIRLAQVITNLLNNAAKYTPAGGHIRVGATLEGRQVVLRVRDDGIGMAPELVARAFDLFMQGDRSLAHAGGGLGIGLTVVRTLVELHGGTVSATSDGPGRGSEFVVRLPVSAESVAPTVSRGESRGEISRPPPLRILVIEDQADMRDLLRVMLTREGHRVDAADGGLPGLDLARSVRPDAVLVDIGLPDLDGYEVGRQIRAILGQSVRLIAVTGYGQAEDRMRSRAAGFDAHLVKPVSEPLLRESLRHPAHQSRERATRGRGRRSAGFADRPKPG
jgi:signal transduction histidine kinase/CheY-like chemotaxis protein